MSVDTVHDQDRDIVVMLHNVARIMEDADNVLGAELRKAADRFSELSEKAANRRHWCSGNE